MVLVAVCALTVSVATRYTFSSGTTDKSATIAEKHQSWSPGLQHLLDNAATWIPPFVDTAIFHHPGSYRTVAKSGPTLPTVLLEKNLYNRPPPSVLSLS
jgi:hypothetical protein